MLKFHGAVQLEQRVGMLKAVPARWYVSPRDSYTLDANTEPFELTVPAVYYASSITTTSSGSARRWLMRCSAAAASAASVLCAVAAAMQVLHPSTTKFAGSIVSASLREGFHSSLS
jgi:hypothetical protein